MPEIRIGTKVRHRDTPDVWGVVFLIVRIVDQDEDDDYGEIGDLIYSVDWDDGGRVDYYLESDLIQWPYAV